MYFIVFTYIERERELYSEFAKAAHKASEDGTLWDVSLVRQHAQGPCGHSMEFDHHSGNYVCLRWGVGGKRQEPPTTTRTTRKRRRKRTRARTITKTRRTAANQLPPGKNTGCMNILELTM